jgi:SOS-response transcriptional repressor LexA
MLNPRIANGERRTSVVDLKRLVHRELSEGLTERELASAVGVSMQTIADILIDELPKDPAIWEQFAQYFRIHADFLRSGGPPHSEGLFELSEHTHLSPLGQMRKVPLLRWDQIDQMVTLEEPPRLIHAQALLETDVPGKRTFAVQVRDNSMQPLFSEGEVIFVNPDLPSEPDQYVLVESEDGRPEGALLRQLKEIGGQAILHPLKRQYPDLPLTKQQRILGRVVRMRKNL